MQGWSSSPRMIRLTSDLTPVRLVAPPRWLIAVTTALFLLKFYYAFQLDLFGDGAFYWLEARSLAFSYSDLPPATALAIRAGVTLFGDNSFGVRFWFIVIAAMPSFMVFWWASDLYSGCEHGATDAQWAAGLTLAIPLAMSLGVLAVPDVLQVVVGLAAFMAFERATRSPALALAPWLLTGLLVGAGFTVHYRFAIIPLSMTAYLLTSRSAFALLRTRGPWLAVLIALPGLAPIAWFNFQYDFAGLSFQFVERHPWQYHSGGLAFWRDQWLATTPVLYPALVLAAIVGLWSRAKGNDRHWLLAIFGLTHVLVYGLASPFMDAQRTNVHWPLLGYLPLAILLPSAIRALWPNHVRRLLTLIVMTGAGGGCLLLSSLTLMTVYHDLPRNLRAPLVSKLSGHAELAQGLREASPSLQQNPLILDQYYIAAQLRLHLGYETRIFLLPEEKAARDGRAKQLDIWHMSLRHLPAENALVLLEPTAWSDEEYDTLFDSLCARFSEIAPLKTIRQFEGERFFMVLSAKAPAENLSRSSHASTICRPAPRIYVDRGYPEAFSTVKGMLVTEGWAYQDDGGVTHISLLIDNEIVASAEYGLERPDVEAFYNRSTDPNHPLVGFSVAWSAEGLAPGIHEVSLEVSSVNGHKAKYWVRPFHVE